MLRSQISAVLMIEKFFLSINFNLFYPGSHPGSTVLLIFIEPVSTIFPNRILKTLLNPLFNSDFRSNAKEKLEKSRVHAPHNRRAPRGRDATHQAQEERGDQRRSSFRQSLPQGF
jgi:hypothetical protein